MPPARAEDRCVMRPIDRRRRYPGAPVRSRIVIFQPVAVARVQLPAVWQLRPSVRSAFSLGGARKVVLSRPRPGVRRAGGRAMLVACDMITQFASMLEFEVSAARQLRKWSESAVNVERMPHTKRQRGKRAGLGVRPCGDKALTCSADTPCSVLGMHKQRVVVVGKQAANCQTAAAARWRDGSRSYGILPHGTFILRPARNGTRRGGLQFAFVIRNLRFARPFLPALDIACAGETGRRKGKVDNTRADWSFRDDPTR